MTNMTGLDDTDFPHVQAIDVACYRIPTDAPEGDGTLRWSETELVVVHVEAGGMVGMGYSYTAALPAARLILDKLSPAVVGRCVYDIPALWGEMNDRLRNIGRPGLGLMAIAAVDQALWDLKARLLDLPLSALWGRARASIPIYGSGGFVTYSAVRLQRQLEGWLEQGLTSVKIKVGDDLDQAEQRVVLAREVIGPQIHLMVDANGACRAREALALAERLGEHRVCWFEEPVSSDDIEGLRWLRDRVPEDMAIAAGEYGWDSQYFRRMLQAGAVDVLQVDATRCGYTGFLHAAELCAAFNVPLSAHCAPALHTSLCVAVPGVRHAEYFHDHVRLEDMLFDSGDSLHGGELWPDLDRVGHGIELRRADAEPYQISG
jgi:L-alanine-DL-glutamate epimerase-like enolase superfamily enzyme